MYLIVSYKVKNLENFLNKISNPITITFAGDFVPNEKTLKLVHENRMHEFAPEVSEILKKSDFSIVNLEAPLTTKKDPIEKTGNNFMAHPDNAKLIKELGFDAVTLANNHILDQNEQGVLDTINACEKVGLKSVGANKNLDSAKDPLIIELKDKKIGFVNLCEQEFNIATETSAGANPFTAIDAYYQISELRPKVDFLIVIFHGGLEYHHIPLPGFIKNCKFMIDCCADAVVCHHTHYISGYEYYKNKPIFYGLGNFYAKSKRKDDELTYSFLLDLVINDKNEILFKIHGINFDTKSNKIQMDDEKKIERLIDKYNRIINDKNKFYQYWNETIKCKSPRYMNLLTSKTKIMYQIKKRIPLLNRTNNFMTEKIRNLIRCESHREILLAVLENKKEEL